MQMYVGFPALACSCVLESKSQDGFKDCLFSLVDLVNLEGVALNPGFTCSCVTWALSLEW